MCLLLLHHADPLLSPPPPQAQQLAQKAKDGRLALFLGAGISAGAGLPTWPFLLKQLAERAGIYGAHAAAQAEAAAKARASHAAVPSAAAGSAGWCLMRVGTTAVAWAVLTRLCPFV